MNDQTKDKIIFLLSGIIIGIVLMFILALIGYSVIQNRSSLSTSKPPKTITNPFKEQDQLFLSFEHISDINFFQSAGNTKIEISDQNASHGSKSALISFPDNQEFPGIIWEVYGKHVQNWSKSSFFKFHVFNNDERSIPIHVKIKSGRDYPKKTFSTSIFLKPLSKNEIFIPISEIAAKCDISEISYIKIFLQNPDAPVTLYFDAIGNTEDTTQNAGKPENQKTKEIQKAKQEKPLKERHEIFIASSLDRIFKNGETLIPPSFSTTINVAAAKNEYENVQIVIANGKFELQNVHLTFSDLKNTQSDAFISQEHIEWFQIGYVPTTKPYYTVKRVGLWPDPLLPKEPAKIIPGETQPFWISFYIPKQTPPGIYQGTATVSIDKQTPHEIPISITVYDFLLPQENHLKTAFDFYDHITSKQIKQKDNETESQYKDRIRAINEKYHIEMVKHRMDLVLNVDLTQDTDLAHVDHLRWFGLSNFAIGRRGGTFNNNWPTTDEEIEKLFPLYRTYGELLALHKMLDMHYIYTWDEGEIGNPLVKKITNMIHRAHPKLKNMVCYHGFWDPQKDPEWGKDIDIWCFGINDYVEKAFNDLKELGMEMWLYVSGPGSTGAPNLAIDFDSIDYRIIPWMCWKYEIKGFLYWCVNWWPFVDPFKNAKNTKWDQNGNGLMFYPSDNEPIHSLRNKIWRDGMEDYEYLILLKNLTEKCDISSEACQDAHALLKIGKEFIRSFRNFTKDTQTLENRRKKIAEAIERLK